MKPDSAIHSGLVAVVGRANVGKSTLLNTIVGEKVSIVSPVAQTTRSMVRAILTEPRGQLVRLLQLQRRLRPQKIPRRKLKIRHADPSPFLRDHQYSRGGGAFKS